MNYKTLLSALLTFCLLSVFSSGLRAECVECVSLEGVHSFSPGDDPSWASPSFDDGTWAKVNVPGDLSDQIIHFEQGIGWYRVHFTLESPMEEPALAMGNVGNADEVFLNGVRIGGEGRIDDGFVEAPWKERLYSIPAGLLRYGHENILAIRILNTHRMAGIFEGPVCIGHYKDLISRNLQLEFARKGSEIALFTLSLLFLLGLAFLVIQGIRSPEYITFAFFLLLYIVLLVLESLYFYDAGLKSPFAQRSIFAISCLMPASGLCFLVCFFRDPMGPWIKAIMGAFLLLALFFLTFSSHKAYDLLMTPWLILFGLFGGTVLFLTIRACVRRRHEARPVFIGIIALAGSACVDLTSLGGNWHTWPVLPADLGMAFLLLCLAYALAARYARAGKAVKQLSGRILESQQEERKRISRNIHDGPGQSLLALKLHLQMMKVREEQDGESHGRILGDLIDEVDRAIKELRAMAMDLRPTFLEDSSIIQLFTLYGKLFAQRTGIPVDVGGREPPEVPMRVKDNVYRIYQEALGNIGKYAHAGRVDVRVENGNGVLNLMIRDNGRGFDVMREMEVSRGIGLMSMKERAELLGGVFHIKSAPGLGCSIRVEVPLK